MLQFVGSRRLRHSKHKRQYKDELDMLTWYIRVASWYCNVILCYLTVDMSIKDEEVYWSVVTSPTFSLTIIHGTSLHPGITYTEV